MLPTILGIGIAALVVMGVIGMGVGIYNRLVTFQNRYENAFAQIEVQLKRRYDLIPNLVETAKGYLDHERGTLEAVIKARNQAASGLEAAAANPSNPAAMKSLAGAERALGGALGRLLVTVERYPELKADKQMMQLSEELTSTENKVAFSRQAYNDSATQYNTYRETFPPVMFASLFGHSNNATLLEFDSDAIGEPPKVSFGDDAAQA